MELCPKCNKPGIIHYPNKLCTRCVLKMVAGTITKPGSKE